MTRFATNTDITDSLQTLIDERATAGGGEVLVPPGVFRFRRIELKSGVCLRLQAGARLLASTRREDYIPIGYHHNEMGDVHSAIFALGARDVTLCGEGEIDLGGLAFYRDRDPSDVPTVGPEISAEHIAQYPKTYDWRVNQPVFFHECEHVRLDGLTFRNASCWTITGNFCRDFKATNLTIDNDLTIPNSDGLHFCGSRDILVRGCHITAGDDCVALSSITDWSRPTENVVIGDCVFQSASKALSIGYMHSIVRNVLVHDVIVKSSNRACVLMAHPHTGLIENVRIHNCILEGRSYAGNWWGNGEPLVVMATPHHIDWYRDPMPADRFPASVRNVTFAGLVCRAERPIAVVAAEPGLIANCALRDSTVEIIPEALPSLKGAAIDLAPGPENLKITDPGAGVVTRNADLRLHNVTDPAGEAVREQRG
ncbi:MAG: glycoside hydrolase family 28 protein [Opitutales bacterium]